jgi:DNA polymerase elongation subunit (family B)
MINNDIQLNIIDILCDDIPEKINEDNLNDKYKKNIFTITLYCKDINGDNIICNITDFKPYFYIKIPDNWSKSYCKNNFLSKINLSRYYSSEVKNVSYSYEFYGYHYDYDNNIEKKFKFMKIEFENYRSFNKYKTEIINFYNSNINTNNKKIKEWIDICNEECEANLYEANIHPIIKFIHEVDIKPTGWISIKNNKKLKIIDNDDKIFNCKYQLETIKNNISYLENDSICDLVIASFDIECDSLTGDFPVAIKDFKQLAVDIYDTYSLCYLNYFKNYSTELEQKVNYIKEIINTSFTGENSIGEYGNNVNLIKTENGNPTKITIDNLSIFSSENIEKIENSINSNIKNSRNDMINIIKNILNKELKNSKNYKLIVSGDPIIQIGTVFYNTNKNTYERYIQIIKPDDCIDEEICDDIENIIVDRCKNEKELLLHWKDMINKVNPDLITGYNIFGFDFNYIMKRVEKFKIESEFYNLGKINSECDGYDNHYLKKCKIQKIFGSGQGENELSYISMDGRVIFDVQSEIKKNHNLESYKLDNVASNFMRGNILKSDKANIKNELINIWKFDDVKYWVFKTNNVGHLKNGDYITINIHSNIGETLLYNKKKFMIKNIIDNHIKLIIPSELNIKREINKYNYTKIEWCLNKDDVSPKEIFDLHKFGGPSGRAKVAKYCIQDCELCINLVNLLDIIPNNIGMSNVCYVPFSYIFLRGQGIKVTSIVSKECSIKNRRMPMLKKNSNDDGGFEGAVVLDPITGIYETDPIVVLDYASLYPSSIIENNCSQDKFVTDEKYMNMLKQQEPENKKEFKSRYDEIIEEITYDDYKITKSGQTIKKEKTGDKIKCYFIKNKKDENGNIIPSSQGIIPSVLQSVLDARKATRNKMKIPGTTEQKKKVLDGLQLAYKITANSVYGQIGARTSSVYMKKIAACTTSIGRKRIDDADNGVKDWAKHAGYEEPTIIYGDTDSVFVKFSKKDLNGKILREYELLKHCIRCGIAAGEFVDARLRKPQNLEYEKTFYPFILISKKRYIGDRYETVKDVDNKKFKRTSMGIVMKRRDNSPIVKYVFGNVIEKIMVDKDFEGALEWLDKTLSDIIDGKFPENYFIISKSLNAYYKNPKSIAHKVLADRIGERDPGNRPKANDRIPYMYIEIDELEPNGFETITVKEQVGYYKNGKPKYKNIKKQGKQKFKKKKLLPGDRIENPDYIKENNIKIDYKYYISNQIMNPVKQVLDLNTNYLDKTNEIFNSKLK